MKILIVSQYFWPEYFRVNDLAKELSDQGHELEVLTGYPNYPHGKIFKDFKNNRSAFDFFDNIKIYRVPIFARGQNSSLFLVINYLSFLLSGIIIGSYKLRKKKYDLIITFATSPIISALVSIFLSKIKNAKHFIWVLDLWPNVLHDLEIIKNNNLIYKIFTRLVNYIYRNSDMIYCQSLSFKREIFKISPDSKEKLVFFPSWPEEVCENHLELKKNKFEDFDKDYLNILFTGNIGEAQNFELVVKIVDLTKNKKIRWYIIGEGRKFQWLKNKSTELKLNNLFLLGLKSFNEIQYYLNNTDILLISLKKGVTFESTIPGKFQTYLKYRKFFLGLIGGEVNKIINKYKLGVANNTQDPYLIDGILNDLLYKKKNNLLKIDEKKIINLYKIYNKKYNVSKIKLHYDLLVNKYKIPLISNINKIKFNNNFILSGLNLAFLGFFSNKDIPINKYFFLWPDGFFSQHFVSKKIKKVPGRVLLNELNLMNTCIKRIIVMGNLEEKSKDYLAKKFGLELLHYQLPYSNNWNDFVKFIPKFNVSDLCILTLPTPKQEQLAHYIYKTQIFCKVLCIGGSVNMLTGIEEPLPEKYENIFFAEALWRLRVDTKRRVYRLFKTLYLFILGKIFKRFKKLNIYIYEKI